MDSSSKVFDAARKKTYEVKWCSEEDVFFSVFAVLGGKKRAFRRRRAMAVAIAVDMNGCEGDAGGKMAARKPNPATNGLGSDGVDGLQR